MNDKNEESTSPILILLFFIFSPVIMLYLFVGAITATIIEFIGVEREWVGYIAVPLTIWLIYWLVTGETSIRESSYVGRDGMFHSD